MLLPCWAHVRFLIYTTYRAQTSTARPCKHISPEGPEFSEAHASCRSHPSEDDFLEWVGTEEAMCTTPDCRLRKCVYIHPNTGDIGGLSDVLYQNLVLQRKLPPPVWFAKAVSEPSQHSLSTASSRSRPEAPVRAVCCQELALAAAVSPAGPALGARAHGAGHSLAVPQPKRVSHTLTLPLGAG